MSDFPGVGPVVKIPHFYYRGCGFDPWSKKIHMLCPVAKKKKKKREEITLDCWDGQKTEAKDNGRVCQREGAEAGRRDLNHEKI